MKIVLVPVGSDGDVYTYVGVGVALRGRGHNVSVVSNPHFHPFIEGAGLRCVPFGTTEQYDAVIQHPDLWHPTRGLGVITATLEQTALELYRVLEAECRTGDTTLVGSGLAFPARVAHETLGVPFVTMHLQPSSLMSVHDMPVLHPWLTRVNALPTSAKRVLLSILDRAADRILTPAANALTVELGLPRVRHITSEWWHSPQRVIGRFPEWYAPRQPDWPTRTVLTGFPRYDDPGVATTVADAKRFLDEGPPPVVFAPGSGNRDAAAFFAAAADASQRRASRAVLLTRYREQIPEHLPDGVRHFDYVPIGQLLGRSAALVHHGGIGTAAQGLAAAVPQVVMPMAFDQHDNARRLVGFGTGRTLRPRAFRGAAVASALDELLDSPRTRERCQRLARRLASDPPIERTCELIEDAATGH